ncbi:MAG: hypothetical protein FWF81_09380 [Defluviitaleaceae bacterium]|nr:hypothetical protein [Defluviitaleaceae bacterium]
MNFTFFGWRLEYGGRELSAFARPIEPPTLIITGATPDFGGKYRENHERICSSHE